jgi:hypothetical protein
MKLVSGVHPSVAVGESVYPPDGMTVVFAPLTGGYGVADVPESVATFLISISARPGEYFLADPESPMFAAERVVGENPPPEPAPPEEEEDEEDEDKPALRGRRGRRST